MEANQIHASIIEYKLLNELSFPYSKYVSYTIRITTNAFDWQIQKRFRNFEELNQKLMKLKLFTSKLPSKNYFFNLSKDVIEERMEQLEIYLNEILSKNNLNTCSEILEFIELNHDTFHIFLGKNKSLKDSSASFINLNGNNQTVDLLKKSRSGDALFQQNSDLKLFKPKLNKMVKTGKSFILEFLKNLTIYPQNKTIIVKDFLNINFKTKSLHKFKKYEISLLLFGDSNINGLLYHCGNIQENKMGAEACLNLLAMLFESEYNNLYEEFIEVLRTSNKEQINSMNLNLHLENGDQKTKNSIYKIISILIQEDDDENNLDEKLIDYNDVHIAKRIEDSFYQKYHYINIIL